MDIFLGYSRLSYSRRASAHAIARNDWLISQGAATGSLLVVAREVVQAVNDKQQIEPLLNQFDALPDEFGDADTLLADTGYFSAANVAACEAAGIEPVIAMGRQPHHPPLGERFCDDPSAPVEAHAGSRRG